MTVAAQAIIATPNIAAVIVVRADQPADLREAIDDLAARGATVREFRLPLLEYGLNKDSFRNKDIVPHWMEKGRLPADQKLKVTIESPQSAPAASSLSGRLTLHLESVRSASRHGHPPSAGDQPSLRASSSASIRSSRRSSRDTSKPAARAPSTTARQNRKSETCVRVGGSPV